MDDKMYKLLVEILAGQVLTMQTLMALEVRLREGPEWEDEQGSTTEAPSCFSTLTSSFTAPNQPKGVPRHPSVHTIWWRIAVRPSGWWGVLVVHPSWPEPLKALYEFPESG